MNELITLSYKLFSVAIFQNVVKDEAIIALLSVFAQNENSLSEAMAKYSKFLKILYESEYRGDFGAYLKNLILYDENIFSKNCATGAEIKEEIFSCAKSEIEIFSELAKITPEKIKQVLIQKFQGSKDFVNLLGNFSNNEKSFSFDEILSFYKTRGFGIFAKYDAFTFNKDCKLLPVISPDTVKLEELKDYDAQKQKLIKNTKDFIEGYEANNVLLYGDRGCGKSSSVKAVFNEFKTKGLKIVQILKADLCVLDKLMVKLGSIPLKFIVFIDDLTFNEENENLSFLKSTLEGTISAKASNIVIYATTNRRHIVKETFSTREGNEVHLTDTIDENASLADRFGIVLTFISPNKDKYIEIAKKIAFDKNIEISDDFILKAEQFALLKASRSPRVAQQFIKTIQNKN